MPYGVFPVVRSLVFLYNKLTVDVNAKSRKTRKRYESVNKVKVRLVVYVVDNALSYVVVDTYALLLNYSVVAGSIYVKASAKSNRSERTVGSESPMPSPPSARLWTIPNSASIRRSGKRKPRRISTWWKSRRSV